MFSLFPLTVIDRRCYAAIGRPVTLKALEQDMHGFSLWGLSCRPGVHQPSGPGFIHYLFLTQGPEAAAAAAARAGLRPLAAAGPADTAATGAAVCMEGPPAMSCCVMTPAADPFKVQPAAGGRSFEGTPASDHTGKEEQEKQHKNRSCRKPELGAAVAGAAAAASAAALQRRIQAAASHGFTATGALQALPDDQQQALLVGLAVLLRTKVNELQQQDSKFKKYEHFHVWRLLQQVDMDFPVMGRLLGLCPSAVGFFVQHPQVFELVKVVPNKGVKVWDPEDDTAGRVLKTVGGVIRCWLAVGLVRGAGEFLLWGTERGRRLGKPLQERVVEVVKQRGLWQEEEGRQQQQQWEGGSGMLSLEEVVGMVPELMKHYMQVRSASGGRGQLLLSGG